MWDHERLRVYPKALDVAVALDRFACKVPVSRSDLRDQLRRASSSIVLNIAEGATEFSPGDKARFYRIARRSAGECRALIDLIERIDADARLSDQTKDLLCEVAAMLTALTKRRP